MWIAEHIAMSLDSSCNAGLVPVLLVALSKRSTHNREVGVEAACTLQYYGPVGLHLTRYILDYVSVILSRYKLFRLYSKPESCT